MSPRCASSDGPRAVPDPGKNRPGAVPVTVDPLLHGGRGQSSVLIYLPFLCNFKLLAATAATLEYAPISPNLPLYDDSLHIQRTRKWLPSPSFVPVPDRCPDQTKGWLTRARLSFAATTPTLKPCPSGEPCVDQGPRTYKRVRLPAPDRWRPRRPPYSGYVRGRETAPTRAKVDTLTALKRDLGKERIVHLDRSEPDRRAP